MPVWHPNNEMTSRSDDASQFCRTLSRIWKMFKYSDAHCYIELTIRERQRHCITLDEFYIRFHSPCLTTNKREITFMIVECHYIMPHACYSEAHPARPCPSFKRPPRWYMLTYRSRYYLHPPAQQVTCVRINHHHCLVSIPSTARILGL